MSTASRDRELAKAAALEHGDKAPAVLREMAADKHARARHLATVGNRTQADNFNRAAARMLRVALSLEGYPWQRDGIRDRLNVEFYPYPLRLYGEGGSYRGNHEPENQGRALGVAGVHGAARPRGHHHVSR